MKRFFLKTVIASVALAAFGMASAQDVKERTIKFATQNPEGHPIVAGMKKFGELVTAKSGGKIKVNLFPGGVLGGDGPNVSALQGGMPVSYTHLDVYKRQRLAGLRKKT